MTNIEELSRHKLSDLDECFARYQNIDMDIAVAKELALQSDTQPDENIGGGRSSTISTPEQRVVEQWEADNYLQELYRKRDACKRAIDRMDNEQLAIYLYRYTSGNYHDWDDVGKHVGYVHSAIYRKRYALLRLLAEELGEVPKHSVRTA